MTTEELLKEALRSHGFDGLYDPSNDDCGCTLDHLAPCGLTPFCCKPGYKIPDETGYFPFRIVAEKPSRDVKQHVRQIVRGDEPEVTP